MIRDWHPLLAWEPHEDGISLGWTTPATCVAPPFAPIDVPSMDIPAAPGENDPRIFSEQQRYGRAIARAWAERGFNFIQRDDGNHVKRLH